jgi:hypothetical protein
MNVSPREMSFPGSARGTSPASAPSSGRGIFSTGQVTRPSSRNPALRMCFFQGAHAGNLNVHRTLRATGGSAPRGRRAGLTPRSPLLGNVGEVLRSAPWIQSGHRSRRRLPQAQAQRVLPNPKPSGVILRRCCQNPKPSIVILREPPRNPLSGHDLWRRPKDLVCEATSRLRCTGSASRFARKILRSRPTTCSCSGQARGAPSG